MGSNQLIVPGDTVLFGTHTKTGKPEEWIVLMTNKAEKTALIAATESAARIRYVNTYVDEEVKEPISWRKCYLRKWLNHYYYNHFTWEEQAAIRYTDMPEEGDDPEPVADKIFILSEGEASLFFKDDESRVLLCNHEYNLGLNDGWRNSCYWWLRDPVVPNRKTRIMQAPVCSDTGVLGEMLNVDSPLPGVRPCMWVDMCALTIADDPGLESLNVRLLEKSRDSLTVFRDGREQVMDVLAEFVDYDIGQSFAVLQDKSVGRPVIARMVVDFCVKSKLAEKYEPLVNALKYKPYHGVLDKLQLGQDESRVASWMAQKAWESTSGYYQPEINDCGRCLVQMGRNHLDPYNDPEPLYWRVIKRESNKILCLSEKGIMLDHMNDDWFDRSGEEHDWANSAVRRWLNEEFVETVFTEDEEARILTCRTVEETITASPLHDRVFLLSDAEVSVFMPGAQDRMIHGTPERIALYEGYSNLCDDDQLDYWWLRTSGRKAESFCVVNPDGTIDRDGKDERSDICAIRPAILVELSTTSIPVRWKE